MLAFQFSCSSTCPSLSNICPRGSPRGRAADQLFSLLSLQNLEKQMRQLAVIPPMLYDADQQRIKFINMNGLMDDPMKVYKDRQVMNMWSEQEKETFREK